MSVFIAGLFVVCVWCISRNTFVGETIYKMYCTMCVSFYSALCWKKKCFVV